jgi:hypothetical protein
MRFHPAFDCTLATRLSLAIFWGMMSMILSHWCSSHRGSTITKKEIFAISSKNHYEFQKKHSVPCKATYNILFPLMMRNKMMMTAMTSKTLMKPPIVVDDTIPNNQSTISMNAMMPSMFVFSFIYLVLL